MASIDLSKIREGMVVKDREGRKIGTVSRISHEIGTMGPTTSYVRVSREEMGRGEIYDIPFASVLEVGDEELVVDIRPEVSETHEQQRIPGMPWKE